mmetsp:Transcript_20679/g.44113  ORF Transcript_20679/g.44113 Transcript_20679/m.44113 type:complete len:87 (-) Transcript_20679:54-314(-)
MLSVSLLHIVQSMSGEPLLFHLTRIRARQKHTVNIVDASFFGRASFLSLPSFARVDCSCLYDHALAPIVVELLMPRNWTLHGCCGT